jgi:phosphopantothenate-cysteine ligase
MAVSDFTVKNVISQNDIIKSIEQKINSNMDKTEIMNIVNNSFLESHDYSKDTKMSSQIEDYMISLKKTIKILDQIKKISHSTKIISFKLLKDVSNEELINVGFEQLKRSNSDYVLANDLLNINQNEHKAFLIDKEKKYITLNNKSEISQEIINIILN